MENAINVLGVTEIPIEIGEQCIPISLCVGRNLPYNLIIGADFFTKYKAIIDMSRSLLKLKPLYVVKTPGPIVISPQSEVVTHAVIYGKVTSGLEGMFSANVQTAVKGLVGAQVLARVQNGRIPVRLLNPSDDYIRLPSGYRVGVFNPLTHQHAIQPLDNNESSAQQELNQTKVIELLLGKLS